MPKSVISFSMLLVNNKLKKTSDSDTSPMVNFIGEKFIAILFIYLLITKLHVGSMTLLVD